MCAINIKSSKTRKNSITILMLQPHLPEVDINNLQLEISRKQTLNLSTHLAVLELLAYWLQVGDKYHAAKLQ